MTTGSAPVAAIASIMSAGRRLRWIATCGRVRMPPTGSPTAAVCSPATARLPWIPGTRHEAPFTCHVPCAFERGSRSRWIEDIARARRLQTEDGVLDAGDGSAEAGLDDMRDARRRMGEGIPNAMKLLEDR